ncbi:hypothetical protein JTB14_004012 [Gonioctena quinquepunctata]|nr:hypothetical protein JTB14_004012 [Gonioctena quinquepunctata]
MSGAKEAMEVEIEAAESTKSSMDTISETNKNVMASVNVGSITCSLHPLVIMNVSEHWTRERAKKDLYNRLLGPLLVNRKEGTSK